jgi:hypothetical protein
MGINTSNKSCSDVHISNPALTVTFSICDWCYFKAAILSSDYDRSKELQNVECFSCLGSLITNDARCTHGIKSIITIEKMAFNKKTFGRQTGYNISDMPHLNNRFVWGWNLDFSENRSEIPWKFLNLVLEKVGEYQLDRSCKKCGILLGVQEQGNILHAIKRREAYWIGHIL